MRWTDSELYDAIRGNGEVRDRGISELRELLVRGLTRSLQNRYGNSISAEDIAQDALIKILKSLDSFQGKSKFTTWAMTIATRVGISALRRKYHADQSLEVFSTEDGAGIEIPTASELSPEATHSRQELVQLLQHLIDQRLTDKQRIVVRAFLSDYSTDGIASATGTNRNAVYKLLHDARARLKEGIEAAGYTASEVFVTLAVKASTS